MKQIHLLTTGGTIAGLAANAHTASQYQSGAVSGAELLPTITHPCVKQMTIKPIFSLGSESFTPYHWHQIYTSVIQSLEDSTCDAIVITHGTDTLEETAFALSLLLSQTDSYLKHPKPIVMTGAMRPKNALSNDGDKNLFDAITVASKLSVQAREVLVVLNQTILSSIGIQKYHKQALDAFHNHTITPFGTIIDQHIIWQHSPVSMIWLNLHDYLQQQPTAMFASCPNNWAEVMITMSYAGVSSALLHGQLTQLKQYGIDHGIPVGWIHAAKGQGTMSEEETRCLQTFANDVPTIKASRVSVGAVLATQQEMGKHDYAAGILTAAQARVLLLLYLNAKHMHPTSNATQLREILNHFSGG